MKPSFHRVSYFKDVSFQVRFLVWFFFGEIDKKKYKLDFFLLKIRQAVSTNSQQGKITRKPLSQKIYKMKTKWRRKRRRKKSCDVFV